MIPTETKSRLRWACAALGCLAALGCQALRVGANPEVPIWVNRASGSLSLSYSREVVAETRRRSEAFERGQPEIDWAGRRLFVGSSDNGLYAIRVEDGSTIWRFETLAFVQSEPLYDAAEDVVYFGSNDGALYKVAARDGKLLWRFATNAEVSKRPVRVGETLFVVNANDTVLALDRKTGELRWSQHHTPAAGMQVAGHAGPLVWRDKVYAAFSDGTVTAYDAASGVERWQPVDLAAEAEQTLGDVPKYLDADTTPVPAELEAGPVVFVGSYEGGVFALDAETGTPVWSNPAVAGVSELLLWQQAAHPRRSGRGPERPARSLLIAGTGTTGLWALDPESGREVWRRTLPSGGVSAPVPMLGALMVSATRLGVFLLNPLDGRLMDGVHTGEGVSGTPAVYGRRAYVVTDGGRLLSFLASPPAIAGGAIDGGALSALPL
jgi:outer membrane protein assembly factor BamB